MAFDHSIFFKGEIDSNIDGLNEGEYEDDYPLSRLFFQAVFRRDVYECETTEFEQLAKLSGLNLDTFLSIEYNEEFSIESILNEVEMLIPSINSDILKELQLIDHKSNEYFLFKDDSCPLLSDLINFKQYLQFAKNDANVAWIGDDEPLYGEEY